MFPNFSAFILPPYTTVDNWFIGLAFTWIIQQIIMRFFGPLLEPVLAKVSAAAKFLNKKVSFQP